MPISKTALTWMVKNIHSRNTIEDFTEEILSDSTISYEALAFP